MIPKALLQKHATTPAARRACRDEILLILRSIKAGDQTFCKERSAEAAKSTREKLFVYDATVVAVADPEISRLNGWLITLDNRGADVSSALAVLSPDVATPPSPVVAAAREPVGSVATMPGPRLPPPIRIFISHSHADQKLAEAFLDYLKACLNTPRPAPIRCTSVHGHGTLPGADLRPQLKKDIKGCDYFILLASRSSVKSLWVTFELGARWLSGRKIVPVVHRDDTHDCVPGPAQGPVATNVSDRTGMFLLVEDIGRTLRWGVNPDSAELDRARERFAGAVANLPQYLLDAPSSAEKEMSLQIEALKAEVASAGTASSRKLDREAVEAGPPDRAKLIKSVNGFHGNPHAPVTERARELLALGEYQSVLALVLQEQEKIVRTELREGMKNRSRYGGYNRTYMLRLTELVSDVVSEDLASAVPVLQQFAGHLHAELHRKGGEVYENEFQEQAFLLATQIEQAYGNGCVPLIQMICQPHPHVRSEFVELLSRRDRTGFRAWVRPLGVSTENCYIGGLRWEHTKEVGEMLMGTLSAHPDGTNKEGDLATKRISLGRIGMQRSGAGWTWNAYRPPEAEHLDDGTAENEHVARSKVLSALAKVAPYFPKLVIS